MTLLEKLREKYLPYDDNLIDPPKDPIVLNWVEFREYLDSLTPEERERVFHGEQPRYHGDIPVVLNHFAPDFGTEEETSG